MLAKILLCYCCVATFFHYCSVDAVISLPVASPAVQAAAQAAVNAVTSKAPYAAKVTSVISATRDAVAASGSYRLNISFVVKNTTCVPPVTDWAKCCQRGDPVRCNASFLCGITCLPKTFSCGSAQPPQIGCAGCVTPQTNLTALSKITRTAVALYASENNGVIASTAKLISASSQVVAGTKYYLEVMVNIGKKVQICNFQVVDVPWLSSTSLISSSCNQCQIP